MKALRACALLLIGVLGISCGPDASEPVLDEAAEVVVTPGTLVVTSLGQQVVFTALVRDGLGREMRGVAVAWTSSNPAVLAQDGGAQFRSVSNGDATVTARVAEVTQTPGDKVVEGTARVTVGQVAASMNLTPGALTLWAVGQTSQWVAGLFDALGSPLAPTPTLTWTSGNPTVATVFSSSGLVTAASDGTAQITAAGAGVSAAATLTVSATVPYTVCFAFAVGAGTATESCTTLNLLVRAP